MDLLTAAASGVRLDTLAALRDVLASSILEADPDKRAALAARLSEVLEQIEKLTPVAKAGDPVDEIAKRRATRGAGSATSSSRATAHKS